MISIILETLDNSEMTHQAIEHALIERLLLLSAAEELVVAVIKALPMSTELLLAVLVQIPNTGPKNQLSPSIITLSSPQIPHQRCHSHAGRTSRNSPPLLQALKFASALRLILAQHVVLIEWLAAVANKEGSGKQRSGCGAHLIDLGDRVWEGGGVDEDGLVEPGGEVWLAGEAFFLINPVRL